jgi:cytochrome oxidase assembly protein ShyY1
MILRKVASDMSRAYRDRVLFKEAVSVVRFRVMQYLGTWQGYRYSGKIDHQLHMQFYYPPQALSEKIPEARQVEPIEYRERRVEE